MWQSHDTILLCWSCSCTFEGTHEELAEHLEKCKFEGLKVSACTCDAKYCHLNLFSLSLPPWVLGVSKSYRWTHIGTPGRLKEKGWRDRLPPLHAGFSLRESWALGKERCWEARCEFLPKGILLSVLFSSTSLTPTVRQSGRTTDQDPERGGGCKTGCQLRHGKTFVDFSHHSWDVKPDVSVSDFLYYSKLKAI